MPLKSTYPKDDILQHRMQLAPYSLLICLIMSLFNINYQTNIYQICINLCLCMIIQLFPMLHPYVMDSLAKVLSLDEPVSHQISVFHLWILREPSNYMCGVFVHYQLTITYTTLIQLNSQSLAYQIINKTLVYLKNFVLFESCFPCVNSKSPHIGGSVR